MSNNQRKQAARKTPPTMGWQFWVQIIVIFAIVKLFGLLSGLIAFGIWSLIALVLKNKSDKSLALIFAIYILLILPIALPIFILMVIGAVETSHPGINEISVWARYKLLNVVTLLPYAAISIYTAYKLITDKQRISIYIASVVLLVQFIVVALILIVYPGTLPFILEAINNTKMPIVLIQAVLSLSLLMYFYFSPHIDRIYFTEIKPDVYRHTLGFLPCAATNNVQGGVINTMAEIRNDNLTNNRRIPDRAKRCPKCGYTESEPFSECPACGVIIRKVYEAVLRKQKDQPSTRSSLLAPEIICVQCGTIILSNSNYCTHCGCNVHTSSVSKPSCTTDSRVPCQNCSELSSSFSPISPFCKQPILDKCKFMNVVTDVVLIIAFAVSFVSISIREYGGFNYFDNGNLVGNVIAETIGATFGIPLIHIGIASFWKSNRNYWTRRNIYLGWAIVIILIQVFSLFTR